MFAEVTVTLDYNYSGSTSSTTTLSNGETLDYPTVPTRSGYAFAGWYTDSACTTMYDFSGTITENITLYAKWSSMASSYNTREYVDIANYDSSSSKKTFSNVSSSSYYNYYYFTSYKTGSYTFYAYLSSGDFYISVYNATKGTTILSSYNMYGSYTSKSVSFSADAGDVIYVAIKKYNSSSSTGSGTFYVYGASYPTSTAVADCSAIEVVEYSYGDSFTVQVGYGEEFTLPTLTRAGYTFLGWYNGDTKVESGIWNYDTNVTLIPRWE